MHIENHVKSLYDRLTTIMYDWWCDLCMTEEVKMLESQANLRQSENGRRCRE